MRATVFKHMVPNVITGVCLPTEISRKAHQNLERVRLCLKCTVHNHEPNG